MTSYFQKSGLEAEKLQLQLQIQILNPPFFWDTLYSNLCFTLDLDWRVFCLCAKLKNIVFKKALYFSRVFQTKPRLTSSQVPLCLSVELWQCRAFTLILLRTRYNNYSGTSGYDFTKILNLISFINVPTIVHNY